MNENEPITYEGVIDDNTYTIIKDDLGEISQVIVEDECNVVVLNFEDLNAALSKAYMQ
jgi:hypothetical protein